MDYTLSSKYSVIVFDLGNVLIPFDYTKPLNHFNKIEAGLGDKFAQYYRDQYNIHREFEKGIIGEEEYLSIMLDWLEHKVTVEQFCRIISDIFTLNEDVIRLIPVLKKKYKVVLLSNTNSIHKRYGYAHYDFLNWFDKLFLSHEVGAVKPEEKIYRTVELYTKKPPQEHFFIDDIQEYIDGAKRCGWDGVQFTGYKKLIIELKKRRIIP